jgi:hypothetical protein
MRRKPLEAIRWMLAIGFAYMVGVNLFTVLVRIPHPRVIAIAAPLVVIGLSLLVSRTAVQMTTPSGQWKKRGLRTILGLGLITFAVVAAVDANNCLYFLVLRHGISPQLPDSQYWTADLPDSCSDCSRLDLHTGFPAMESNKSPGRNKARFRSLWNIAEYALQ